MPTPLRQSIAVPSLACLFLCSTTVSLADESPGGGALLVDGISILSGGPTANESDAVPLLLSDIEFESVLILTARMGPAGLSHPPSGDDWVKARRRATLIRLLAGQARHFHETADPDMKRQLLSQVIDDVGGEEALGKLMARFGMMHSDLDRWIENAVLALTQIRYMKDQVELPSRRDVEAKALAEEGRFPDSPSEREQYRRMVLEEKTNEQIQKWLEETSKRGHIRMVR